MARVPGVTPDPQPDEVPHHEHLLPDEAWGEVVRRARRIREESDESEVD
jgi:hypothetical protein